METVLGTFNDGQEFDDFDESRLPASGYEYLRRVQFEAMQCPDVVVANLDTKRFSCKQTVHVDERTGWSPAPTGFAPSLAWQQQQSADFADVRQKLVHHRAKLGKASATIELPKRSDVNGWCRFCLGEEIASKITKGKGIRNATVEGSTKENGNSQNTNQVGMPPLLSVLQQINQATLLHVLEYHVTWLEEVGFSHFQGQWLYALLVCLEKPLLPESTSLIRTLARLCSTLRASLDSPEHEWMAPLNLIITIVSRYFGQSDLADPG